MVKNYIGDTEITTINDIDPTQGKNVDEIDVVGLEDPVVVEHDEDLTELSIASTLIKQLSEGNLTVDQQREHLKALLDTCAATHSFDYLDWTGWLSISSVDVPRDASAMNIIDATIEAQFLPAGDYIRGVEVGSSLIANDYSIDRSGLFTLPSFVDNVRVKNPITEDEVSITPIATESTTDGDIDIYNLWSTFDSELIGLNNGATREPQLEYSGLQSVELNADNEYVGRDFGPAPSGRYSLNVRLRDDNVADDIELELDYIDKDGNYQQLNAETINQTGTTAITTLESNIEHIPDNLSVSGSVKKLTTQVNTIEIDGIWLTPNYQPQILFDVDLSLDPSSEPTINVSNGEIINMPDRIAPVRVYDDTGSSTESDWIEVKDDSHNFSGDVVVENGISRLRIIESDSFHFYSNDGNGYLEILQGNRGYNVEGYQIVDSGPEVATIQVYFNDDGGQRFTGELSIKRGSPLVRFKMVNGDSNQWGHLYFADNPAQEYASTNEGIINGKKSDGTVTIPSSDNFIVIPSRRDNLFVGSATETGISNDVYIHTDTINTWRPGNVSNGESFFFGCIPFPESPNLQLEAENGSLSGGTAIDHWEMALTHPDGKRELHKDKQNFTLDDTNGVLQHTNDSWDDIFLHALDWGASEAPSHYHWEVSYSDTTNGETVAFNYAIQDTATDTDEYDIWGDLQNGSIEIRHFDATGTKTIISSSAFAFTAGTNYHFEVEWDPSTGSHDVYVWADGNGKPASPEISITDSSISQGGQIGYAANGSVDLHGWSVDAQESSSSAGSSVIVETDGLSSATNPNVVYSPTAGTDIPQGTYLAAIRVKDTLGTAASSVTMTTNNGADGANLAIDGGVKYKQVEDELGYDYVWVIREFRVNDKDNGDSLNIGIFNTESTNAGHIAVDEFAVVPVSLQNGGDRMGPQDITHEAVKDLEIEHILKEE